MTSDPMVEGTHHADPPSTEKHSKSAIEMAAPSSVPPSAGVATSMIGSTPHPMASPVHSSVSPTEDSSREAFMPGLSSPGTPSNELGHIPTENVSVDKLPVSQTTTGFDEHSLATRPTLVPSESSQSSRGRWRALSPALPLKESLGLSGCFSVIGGSVGVLAILAFLAFLWFGYGTDPEARGATRLWRLLALRDWMTQTITLCCLLLTFTVTVQSTVCTSMIAALVLEKHRIRKSQVAYLSVIRGINDGPHRLFETMFSSGGIKAMFLRIESWLALLLVCCTLTLQFSSTILLADLHDFIVLGDKNTSLVNSLLPHPLDPAAIVSGPEMAAWTPVYATFGEEQSGSNAAPDMLGFSDSGLLRRGFLPFPDSGNRTTVRSYEGNAMVMNSRVACMRPVMTANYTPEVTPSDSQGYGRVRGLLDLDASLQRATAGSESLSCASDACQTEAFDCYLPANTDGRSQSSYCRVNEVDGPFYSFDTLWSPSEPPWVVNSSIYLVFTTNMNGSDWGALSEPQVLSTGSPYQEWNTHELSAGSMVNASLCFSAFKMERQSVRMSTANTLSEPVANWTLTTSTWDTSALRTYLGLNEEKKSPEGRGILSMTVLGPADNGPSSSPANEIFSDLDASGRNMTRAEDTETVFDELYCDVLSTANQYNQTYSGCQNCILNALPTHSEVYMLWGDVIASTGRAVDALQTLKTVAATTLYDTYMKSMGDTEEVDITTTKRVLTPGPCSVHGCGGFISVTVLLLVHLLCVAIVSVLYLTQVEHSRCGSIWHAVSQLVSQEMKDIIEKGNSTRDGAISSSLRREGTDDFVRLGRQEKGDRVEVVQHSRDDRKPLEPKAPRLARLKKILTLTEDLRRA